MKQYLFIIFFFTAILNVLAQQDTIFNSLDEVFIQANKRLLINSKTLKVIQLNDSVILNNNESFTNLLRFNSSLYFREQGAGGSSSVSFRGTSSSNTAVMWNGININSINNSQTDFNSLTVGLFDEINVRSGGGTIEYGSDAIGGTIHINDLLKFDHNKNISNNIITSYGSFNTFNSLYKLKFKSKRYSLNFGLSFNGSDNDYPFLDSDFKNTNGSYKNYALNFSNALKISNKLVLELFSTFYFGDRLFSGELPNPSSANDKYHDINQRNLLSLIYSSNNFRYTGRVGYLYQKYKFFENKNSKVFNYGTSKRIITDFTLDYQFVNMDAVISSISRFESVYGETDQINQKNRIEFSQSLIYKHNILDKFLYDLKLRKDYNSDFQVPLSFSFGFKLNILDNLFIRANTSKNYRIPSYNDLFWPGQGNLNLIPESSLQGELGFGFKTKSLFFDIAYFNINTKDKIIWTPNGDPNRPGVWVPLNIDKTNNKGVEFSSTLQHTYFNKILANYSINFTYVVTLDKTTGLPLPFIPENVLNFNMSYAYKKYSFFYQFLFNDKVFTTKSNSQDYKVDSYSINNIGVNYDLIKSKKNKLNIGFKFNNLFNKKYFIVTNRPMPGFNYNFNINYKF
ncbi:TonB-dependent receptor plug domain-containing protein [Tenacibaculum geojense]|uniref:TonB-dependent receptor plug domain-containing protein n=1 Tax=Tenacibaculum geojense TaxID=915352 RepID=A0ABW3JML8_9FLAO